jgi:hypothetical protein
LLSGIDGLILKNNFLIIENKFSKAGYHNNKTIKIGDINLLLFVIFIKKIPTIKLIKKEPESPK